MANSAVIHKAYVELHEGDDVPTMTTEFDEDKEYGAYGVLGYRPTSYYAHGLLAGATVVSCLPYNKGNTLWVQGLLNKQMQLCIPESHQKWVEWVNHMPGNNPVSDPVGTIGWKYRKKDE